MIKGYYEFATIRFEANSDLYYICLFYHRNYFPMAVNRNQPVRFLFIVILIVRASTDYFAGLPLDQKLIDNANIALDRLKHKL